MNARYLSVIAGFLAAFSLSFTATSANATGIDALMIDPPEKPWKIRTSAIGLFFDVDAEGGLAPLDVDLDSTADLAVDVTYFLNRNIAVQALGTFANTEVKAGSASLGSVDVLPPIFTLQWHFVDLVPEGVDPYVGVGFNFNHFDNESGALSDGGTVDGTTVPAVRVEDTFGFAAETGIDFPITENVFVNATYKFVTFDADVDAVGGGEVGNLDTNLHIVGAGIGYHFGL